MSSNSQQVPLLYEPPGHHSPEHSYPPSFFTSAVPAPRHDAGATWQARNDATRLEAPPSTTLPALIQANLEAPKSALLPCVAYSNASQAIVSAVGRQMDPCHVEPAPPVRQPKNPARQAPVPWPKVHTSSPDDQPSSANDRSIVEHQQQARQPDTVGGFRTGGQSESRGRAGAKSQKQPHSPPPRPVWDKDDELSGQRKAERIKRRKIEQWAREVRQQAQREHLAAERSETSIKSIVSLKRTHHEVNEADESNLPASTTATYGPAFGATFGDLYGGRGKLFADAAILGPTNKQSNAMSDCLYLNPFYGLVDSSQLSKEALEAQNALYAYRQRKERDQRSVKVKDFMPCGLTAPQSTDSRPSSGFATRKRTDQVRLDPSEIDIVRQRSAMPVAAQSDDVLESRQGSSSDGWLRQADDKGVTPFSPNGDPRRQKLRDDDNLVPLDGTSDDVAGSWELPRPYDYRRAVKRHMVVDPASVTLPLLASARIITSDEALLFLEEGIGAEEAELQDLSMEDAVTRPVGTQQTERVTSLGISTITANHPSHLLSPRHLDPQQYSAATRLAPSHYLDQQPSCAHEDSIEMIYYGPEKPKDSNDSTAIGGGRVRRHAAEVMLASGDVSLHLTPAEDMEVDVFSEHHSDEDQPVVEPSWNERNHDQNVRDGRHCHVDQHRLNPGPSFDVASPDHLESVASSPQDRSGLSHALGSTPAVSIRPPPEDTLSPLDRYRPRPVPRKSQDLSTEHSPDPSTGLPGQRSFSGSGDTLSSIEPGDHTYTKLWQAIQTMLASSGKGSHTSLLSTSSGLHSGQQLGPQSMPREGGGKLGAAKASICTEDIPALELDGSTGREGSHAPSDMSRGAQRVKESNPSVRATNERGAGLYDATNRLLSPRSSAGRLNVLASQGTLDRRAREQEKNKGDRTSGSTSDSAQPVLPLLSLSVGMQAGDDHAARPLLQAHPTSAKQGNPSGEGNENVRIATYDEHNLLVPIDGLSDMPMHPSTHAQLHAFPRVPPRPSLRKMASRQSLRAMRSDVSMRTAGSLSQSQALLDEAGDLSGILEEAKSDVAMRTASGQSSSHGHGHEGAGAAPASGVALDFDSAAREASNGGYLALAAQEEMQQRALIYGKRRRRESGRLL
ncbi:hypothetical protein BCV69DRAFT_191844 [Microstroma glucosiphilum]|uniref:Uncharacterized protein n=1 Tax=Pseudomicrostroma glucosiphilum TaxID=1684307 RepID=A0A316U5K1_9BASI|nr:hypothetical protein BCV69DRAFT_191844 [Pseudomicrostroma glucosiphilum]PWN20537.1 hypothetical protein BCV69DRAFT_191844 [Pseudomicrostroma glucosiphilum]